MVKLSPEQLGFTPWLISRRERCLRLTGFAGSGKTTVMEALSEAWDASHIMWCAPTHPAKDILAGKIKGNVLTVDSALGFRPTVINGRSEFKPLGRNKVSDMCRNARGKTLLVIDESSMLSRAKVTAVIDSKVDQILFVGDPAQIPPVKEICSPVYEIDYPTYHLSHIYRQETGSIISLASDIRESGIDTTARHGIPNDIITDESLVDFFMTYQNDVSTMILCPTHAAKEYCNAIARKAFNRSGEGFSLGDKLFIEATSGAGINAGDMVSIITDPVLTSYLGFKVYELTVTGGKCMRIPVNLDERKKVQARKDALPKLYAEAVNDRDKDDINVEAKMLDQITFASSGYAMTIHASQGSTFDNVLVFVRDLRTAFKDDSIRRRMMYTAVTRAKYKLIIGR